MNWPVKKLGDILSTAEIFTDGDWVESKDHDVNGSIRLLQLADIGDGNFINKSNRFINESTFIRLKCTEVQLGDILIARMPDPLGRACIFEGISQKCITVVDVCIIRVDSNIVDARWLMHAINSDSVRRQISSFAKGATRVRISRKNLSHIQIEFPPLAEQQRIAEVLDTADRIHKQRESAIAKLDQLAQSVFVEMFGNVSNNSKKWQIKDFSELADNEDCKRKPIKSSDRDNRGGAYPYYGASGIIDTIDEYIFEGNSLLVGEDGANLVARSSPIAFIAREKYWVNNHAHILRQNRNANIRFLEYFLLQIDLKPYVTGSAQPKLTRGNLDRIRVPTPPIKLQNDFEKIIIELEAEKDVMNLNHRVSLNLMSSLQHQSFAVN